MGKKEKEKQIVVSKDEEGFLRFLEKELRDNGIHASLIANELNYDNKVFIRYVGTVHCRKLCTTKERSESKVLFVQSTTSLGRYSTPPLFLFEKSN